MDFGDWRVDGSTPDSQSPTCQMEAPRFTTERVGRSLWGKYCLPPRENRPLIWIGALYEGIVPGLTLTYSDEFIGENIVALQSRMDHRSRHAPHTVPARACWRAQRYGKL